MGVETGLGYCGDKLSTIEMGQNGGQMVSKLSTVEGDGWTHFGMFGGRSGEGTTAYDRFG